MFSVSVVVVVGSDNRNQEFSFGLQHRRTFDCLELQALVVRGELIAATKRPEKLLVLVDQVASTRKTVIHVITFDGNFLGGIFLDTSFDAQRILFQFF